MNTGARNILLGIGTFIIGGGAGYVISDYIHLKNTPESVIANLNSSRDELKREKEELRKETIKNNDILNELRKKKKEYQDEIRSSIEKDVREELKEYIEEADKKYDEAKRENEMAEVRLELAKKYYNQKPETNYYDWMIKREEGRR